MLVAHVTVLLRALLERLIAAEDGAVKGTLACVNTHMVFKSTARLAASAAVLALPVTFAEVAWTAKL